MMRMSCYCMRRVLDHPCSDTRQAKLAWGELAYDALVAANILFPGGFHGTRKNAPGAIGRWK